ncbi:MAG: HNH endonuclease [Planctomycetota bacterium]
MKPAPAAEHAAQVAQRMITRAEHMAAKALATIERRRAYVLSGYASAQAWAEANDYGDQQARRLLALGRALAAAPELERKVRSRAVTADAVLAVGKVLCEPSLKLGAAERKAWIEKACTLPPRQLREEAAKAVEEARQGEATFPMRFHVTAAAKDGFHRTRLLMSRGQPRLISEGQTFGRLVQEWLAGHDPRLKPLPSRRSGPTRGTRSRYRPKQVDAIVEQRSGGTCEICRARRAVAKIHLAEPHAKGGSREPENIADSCWECHVMVDANVFRFSHFDRQGRPQFTFHPGPLVGRSRQPSEVRERAPPRYAVRRPAEALVGSGSIPFG